MSDLSDLSCSFGEQSERVRYFPRQLITADDMRAEQEYFREKARRHNRYLHGWGVVCGCTVEAVTLNQGKQGNHGNQGWQVRVCPGYAVDPQGDDILIDSCITVDLQVGAQQQPCSVRWPCPPAGEMPGINQERGSTVYVAVRYAECFSRPTRVHPGGCGCDEIGCEYTRIRDSFEIKVLWELPASHLQARKDDEQWCRTVQALTPEALQRRHALPVPPCPPCPTDPWVVLATVYIPPANSGPSANGNNNSLQITTDDCRVLLATQRIQVASVCLP